MGNVSLDIGTTNAQEIKKEEAHVLACELFGISEGVKRIWILIITTYLLARSIRKCFS